MNVNVFIIVIAQLPIGIQGPSQDILDIALKTGPEYLDLEIQQLEKL